MQSPYFKYEQQLAFKEIIMIGWHLKWTSSYNTCDESGQKHFVQLFSIVLVVAQHETI